MVNAQLNQGVKMTKYNPNGFRAIYDKFSKKRLINELMSANGRVGALRKHLNDAKKDYKSMKWTNETNCSVIHSLRKERDKWFDKYMQTLREKRRQLTGHRWVLVMAVMLFWAVLLVECY